MSQVFPPRNLPGRSEEWGRTVEKRIEGGESSETQLSQRVDNGLRAANGQLAVLGDQIVTLGEQVSDLSGRTSYSSSDLSTYSYNSTSVNDLTAAEIRFALDRPRKVRMTFNAQVMANTNSAGVNTAAGHLTFRLNGSEIPPSGVARGFVSAMSTEGGFLHLSAAANTLQTLPAGTYSVVPRVTATIVGTAAITVTNSFLFIDVLEPTV